MLGMVVPVGVSVIVGVLGRTVTIGMPGITAVREGVVVTVSVAGVPVVVVVGVAGVPVVVGVPGVVDGVVVGERSCSDGAAPTSWGTRINANSSTSAAATGAVAMTKRDLQVDIRLCSRRASPPH